MQLINENNMLYTKNVRIDFDKFLAEAAGIKNRASTREAPIIFIDETVTKVISKINIFPKILHELL